jgi:glycosyltransferase involved in cell wall biosynthesis
MNARPFLSVIVPAYNEASVLEVFHRRLAAALADLPMQTEVIYVNDGSSDNTLDIIHSLRMNQQTIGIVDLSRNYGKEIAMAAGIDHARGDAVVLIDADLQDPPELIPELVKNWQNGYDGVYAVRLSREGESWLKKVTAHFFYRLMNRLSRIPIPEDTGDFRLLSRRAVDALRKLREQHRFTKGLFSWIGFPQKAVYYHRNPRVAGKTKWNYWRLWNFALEGITSFTTAPLRMATYLGLLTALTAFLYAGIIIYKTLAFGEPVRGYPSLMVVILFLGGIQLVGIGIIGEYLGRIFDETKLRPLYFLKDYVAPAHDEKPQ